MLEVTNKRTISIGGSLSQVVLDPKFYITIALFAGEAGPELLKSSGWMYIFGFIGLLMLLAKGQLDVRNRISIVLLIYGVILLRNISINDEVIFYYELPNLGTAFLLLILNCVFFKEKDIERIENYIFFYATLLATLGMYRFIRNPAERLAVFGGPNGYYKIALLFEILCFYQYLNGRKKSFLAGAILGLILCMATGSKGGIVSMVVILTLEVFFFIFNSGERRGCYIKRLIQISFILIIGYFLIRYAINKIPGLSIMLARANVFVYSKNLNSLTSVNTRTNLIELGLKFFTESPIIGKGARYTYFYTGGTQPYPHNIFVEFLSENGLLATIPLAFFFLEILIITVKHGMRDSRLYCLFLCLAVYLSGALFSGNILDAKPMFVFGILIFNYTYNVTHSLEQENRA